MSALENLTTFRKESIFDLKPESKIVFSLKQQRKSLCIFRSLLKRAFETQFPKIALSSPMSIKEKTDGAWLGLPAGEHP